MYFVASRNPLLGSFLGSAEEAEDGVVDAGQVVVSDDTPRPSSTEYSFVELCPGGAGELVQRSNRARFVELFLNHTLYSSVKSCVDDFISGFKILWDNTYDICTHTELEIVINGSPDVGDISDLRMHTEYRGEYNDEHHVIQWFWNIVSSFTAAQHRKLLHFITGSDRVPVGGLQHLNFIIQPTLSPAESIPVSHTCFNILDLPSTYTSEESLRGKIIIALEHHQGFGLV